MCELCKRRDKMPSGVDLWRDECQARELDPDHMPEAAERAVSIMQVMVFTVVTTLGDNPAELQYLSAAFAAWSRASAGESELAFSLIKESIFGEDGPTMPDVEG